jgi:regulator of nucleoside diphosphate kinase
MTMNVVHTRADLPAIKIEKRDFEHLDILIGSVTRSPTADVMDFLSEELVRAEIVENGHLPDTIVGMRSYVTFRDEESGVERTVTLVYPSEKSRHSDGVSILTPAGSALIGLSEGHSIAYRGADGRPRRITVVKVWPRSEDDI